MRKQGKERLKSNDFLNFLRQQEQVDDFGFPSDKELERRASERGRDLARGTVADTSEKVCIQSDEGE